MDTTRAFIAQAFGGAVPQAVTNYVQAHPYLTGAQVVLAPLALFPGLTWVPVAGWMGFGAIGPTAGTAAAAYQAAHGTTWAFSGLQSAAMGGYGAAVVNGVMQGAYGASIGVAEYLKWR